MSALYQKYRPQKFSEVVGQEMIVQTLRNAVKTNTVSHAYIFCGSRGVGKTTFARIFARAVNCLDPQDGDVCLSCASCVLDPHLDIVEIDAASYTGVDNIREVIDQARLLPNFGKKRVFIIDEAHMLSRAAFNALLKTLEEPPEHILFILATTEAGKLPATVASRAQRFDFLLHKLEDIEKRLLQVAKAEDLKVSEDVVSLIAEASQGGLRDALTLLDQATGSSKAKDIDSVRMILGLPDRSKSLTILRLAFTGQSKELVEELQALPSGMDPKKLLFDILSVLRMEMEGLVIGGSLEHLPGFVRLADLVYAIRLFLRGYKEVSGSPDQLLPLLLVCLELSDKYTNQAKSKSEDSDTTSEKVDFKNNQNQKNANESTGGVVMDTEQVSKVEVASGVASEASLEALRLVWKDICGKATLSNNSFGTILRQARLDGVRGGVLHLSVKFDFHKKQMEQAKYAQLFLNLCAETGQKLSGVMISVDKQMESEHNLGFASALQVFGGELVEE